MNTHELRERHHANSFGRCSMCSSPVHHVYAPCPVELCANHIDALEARIAELETELAESESFVISEHNDWAVEAERARVAEARLAAVVALCDADLVDVHGQEMVYVTEVRAAATGDTT